MDAHQHNSAEHEIELNISAVKPFLRRMALVSKRYAEREEAQKGVDALLFGINKASGKKQQDKRTASLKDAISRLVEAERKFSGYREPTTGKAPSPDERIAELEFQLEEQRCLNAEIRAQYRIQIEEMKHSFAEIKTKMIGMIDERRQRDARLAALQERIRRTPGQFVSRNSPLGDLGKEEAGF